MSCITNKARAIRKKKVEFFSKKGVHNQRKLVRALSRHHPGYTKSKLHPHHTAISFPPQANNKTELLRDTEVGILNLGPSFVPPAPEQVLKRLPKEIQQMKEKISAAWRRTTKTIGREPPIVTKFENSYFVLQLPGLEPKYYKQTRGGAMGSACTQVLADIYVRKWESDFVQKQQQENELYFRFRDDVFITTRLMPQQIESRLSELNKKDANLKITWEGGKKVDYLDVTTEIETPNFKTTVFRKLAAQPYVLPFHSSHPKHITRNIPHAAALRATRICSHRDDLRNELDRIRIMLLLNKYPPRFIDKQMERFFQEVTKEKTGDLLLGIDHHKYREKVLDPT
ncbi:unnamed protein product [Rotaria socialis]